MTVPAARITDTTVHGGLVTTGLPTVLIGGKPAARVTDMHTCPLVTGAPHVGGPIVVGSPTVIVGGLMLARVTDRATCVGPPDVIAAGEPTVLVGLGGAASMSVQQSFLGTAIASLKAALRDPYPRAVVEQPSGLVATEYSEAITIRGTFEFQATVMSRLDTISQTRSGRKLLRQIDGSGKDMSIVEHMGNTGNSFASPDPSTVSQYGKATAKGKLVYDGAGGAITDASGNQLVGTGEGTDSEVEIDPYLTLPNPMDPTRPVPNDAVLFHEMTHGAHFMRGRYYAEPLTGWTTTEEQVTILTGNPSEASYLRDSGYPYHRISHSAIFAPNPPRRRP